MIAPTITFRSVGFGREVAMLHQVEVGAIMEHDGRKVRAAWQVFLPLPGHPRGWRPATSMEAARHKLSECVRDWLVLARLKVEEGR
jgi:hypothetical protein